MSWLVTGGAGYIGSHVVRAFIEQGITPIVVDDLSSGHREFVPDGVDFVEGQVQDTSLLERTMREHDVEGVMHIAGYKYAGVSVARPLHTYSQNVQGTAAVLEAMQRVGVSRIVFSSSAAVYGTPDVDLVTED
ncbi:UDP-glucose 4-epimerase, partial [Propionibacterium freudenreichii]|nr:UDP-glucose 4-epimerase [Propionibacterium freudenreichii]